MKSLTQAEEILMKVMWRIEKGMLREIMSQYQDPKPHHNTVATVLKILVEKGFLKITRIGRFNEYEVKVSKEEYINQLLKYFLVEYFDNDPNLLLKSMEENNFIDQRPARIVQQTDQDIVSLDSILDKKEQTEEKEEKEHKKEKNKSEKKKKKKKKK